ncbi:MAG: threonine/serine exporter family protein [Succiniclasticum sp.]|uniref:threonine/serine exporter family protein n=1 Tax=Succiniclasticum sp. TaxID=2775030 RepID=UPI002A91E32A|nr:threonine/serine exporter family protein [Succiniclasticum sp.]MDY6292404.1 threonine/serine exporter family protein [Succiniclasticum sp.]
MKYAEAFVFAFFATVAFGVLFQGPKRILWRSGIIGGIGWVIFIVLKNGFSIHSFSANFLATIAIAVISEIFARVWKEPVTVFEIPAIIPLVPGLGMYQGMRYILNNYVNFGNEILLGAALDSCAIALGIMMVSGIFRALKTGNDFARQRQQDLLGTEISPELYVTDPENEADNE